jgi:lipopolysaccharide/colanic/teichoic acid biosynthesis glycosyltransferase
MAPLPRWKRWVDLLCLAVSLPVVVCLGAVIALWIKLVSSGPVFFRQERVGYHGQRFLCFKFRTMRVSADTSNHQHHLRQLITSEAPMTKLDSQGDDRLIAGAAFLRATGLDELPQLLNVWRTEMSLVGPRPCLPYEYEQYSDWQKGRFAALPGLTGLWQVSGKNRTTFNQMIHLDIQYAEHKSLWLDLAIMLKTPVVLLKQILDVRGTTPDVFVRPLQKAVQ